MDLTYPLRYQLNAIATTPSTNTASQARHLIDTILGERILYPNFGIPLDALFSLGIPELLAERLRLAIKIYLAIDATVSIVKYEQGSLTIKIEFPQEELVIDYALPAAVS